MLTNESVPMFEKHYRFRTHAVIPAATQGGKSKLTEYCCRDHNLDDEQVLGIDGKGTTFYGMANYYARIPPRRKCIFIDPNSKRTLQLRFFHPEKGANPSAHASNVAKIILNALGSESVSETPRYRRMVNMLASYCAASGMPIGDAMQALYFHNKHLARHAADTALNQKMRDEWLDLAETKTQAQYSAQTESVRNRLDPFLSIDSLRRMFGGAGGESVIDIIESGANLWTNLTPTEEFPEEACRIVGGYLVSKFKDFSLRHARHPHKLYAYLDEPEMYASPDLSSLLELSAGSGMRCTLIYHHEDQFPDKRLIQNINKNCRIKFIGAGTTMDEAKRHAEQHHFRELSTRKKKDDLYSFVTDHIETPFETFMESDFGHSRTFGTHLEPVLEKVANGQVDFTPEEKLLQQSIRYLTLRERQFRVITPESDELFEVPEVFDYLTDSQKVLEFMQTQTRPNDEIDAEFNKEQTRAFKKPTNARSARR